MGNNGLPGWWQASDGRWYPPSAHPEALTKMAKTPAPESAGIALARRGRHDGALPPAQPSSPIAGSSSHETSLTVAIATFGADIEPERAMRATAVLNDPNEVMAYTNQTGQSGADDHPARGGLPQGELPQSPPRELPQSPPQSVPSSPDTPEGGGYVAYYPQQLPGPGAPYPQLAPGPNTSWQQPGPRQYQPGPYQPGPYQPGPYQAGQPPIGLAWPANPADFPPYLPQRRKRTGLWIGIAAVCVFVVGSVAFSAVHLYNKQKPKHLVADPRAASTVTATSPVTAHTGRQVYHDDLTASSGDWPTLSKDVGAGFVQDSHGYTVLVEDGGLAWSPAPYRDHIDQISASASGFTVAGSQSGGTSGLGMECGQDIGKATELHYMFVVFDNGVWAITTARGSGTSASVSRLKRGQDKAITPGSHTTVTGVCATLTDRQTTRLLLFIDDVNIADISDTKPSLPNSGWSAGLVGGSASDTTDVKPQPVATFTNFTIRDASKS